MSKRVVAETKSAKKSLKPKEFDAQDWLRPGVSKDDIKEIKMAFDLLDNDKSGSIDPNELKAAFDSLGLDVKDKVLYQILSELDKDNSGLIEFGEFFALCTAKRVNINSREEIEKTFDFFDHNGNGKITLQELRLIADYLGEIMSDDDLGSMFRKADSDNDGFVTKEDFYTIVYGQTYS